MTICPSRRDDAAIWSSPGVHQEQLYSIHDTNRRDPLLAVLAARVDLFHYRAIEDPHRIVEN